MGVDDLLLGLTHHWSRDTSAFPTEDDRLDLPTIMLFQAYTACRPAELVDGSRSREDKDPLLDGSEDQCGDTVMLDVDLNTASDMNKRASQENQSHAIQHYDPKAECDTETDSESDFDETLFDEVDNYDSDATHGTYSSSSNSEEESDEEEANDITDESNLVGDEELCRKYKALCYEDIVLWSVRDPKNRGRDVLAMEVHFRHHKGVDNKPKPYVSCVTFDMPYSRVLTMCAGPSFYFAKTLSQSCVP